MPRLNDITKILVIGSGPIVIGQSAELPVQSNSRSVNPGRSTKLIRISNA
jgi:hypothetical protein